MSGGGGAGDTQYSRDALASVPAGSETSGTGAAGGTSGGGGVNCRQLEFVARLRNVDPDEADAVQVGSVLRVEERTSPRRIIAVVRVLKDGSSAPTPLGALLDRLAEVLLCLQVLEFEAEVIALNQGDVRVLVRPASAF